MKNQNVIKQLSGLKEVKPDASWKAKNRELLINQIYGSQIEPSTEKSGWVFYFRLPVMMARNMSQPTMVALLMFLVIAGSGMASIRVAKDTKPGDSLYAAKLFKEQTQLVLTFDEKEKAKLGIEFAKNRVEEMNKVLAEPTNGSKDERVGTLLNNFNKQISEVRTRISKISPDTKPTIINNDQEGGEVFSANLNKDNQGIQVSEPTNPTLTTVDNAVKPTTGEKVDNIISTSSPIVETTTTTASNLIDNVSNTTVILKEAGELLNEEKYGDTLMKLEEANKLVTQVDKGEVKGAEENATSTSK